MKAFLIAVAALASCSSAAEAWNDRGHSVVTEIAYRHMTDHARAKVQEILGNRTRDALASWADDFKYTKEGAYSKPWHFISFPYDGDDQYTDKICAAEGCVVSAIRDLSQKVTDPAVSAADRETDLKLLIHIVGDSTMPFHCVDKSDHGASDIMAEMHFHYPDNTDFPTGTYSVHHIWDDYLVDTGYWSWGTYAAILDEKVVPTVAAPQMDGDFVAVWINECHAVGKAMYQALPTPRLDGTYLLDGMYQDAMRPVVDKQLATGGLRLAALLNKIFP